MTEHDNRRVGDHPIGRERLSHDLEERTAVLWRQYQEAKAEYEAARALLDAFDRDHERMRIETPREHWIWRWPVWTIIVVSCLYIVAHVLASLWR